MIAIIERVLFRLFMIIKNTTVEVDGVRLTMKFTSIQLLATMTLFFATQ